eukprot:10916340-Heterocapsa_arctica.AAC.1
MSTRICRCRCGFVGVDADLSMLMRIFSMSMHICRCRCGFVDVDADIPLFPSLSLSLSLSLPKPFWHKSRNPDGIGREGTMDGDLPGAACRVQRHAHLE